MKGWMKMAFKKIIYIFSTLALIAFTIFFIVLLPVIYIAGVAGIIFIIMTIIFMGSMLYREIKNNKNLQEAYLYNIFIIMLTLYMLIVFCKLGCTGTLDANLYAVNSKYCQINFILLSVVLFILTINFKLLTTYKETENVISKEKERTETSTKRGRTTHRRGKKKES
jgi:hypothetical protein